MEIDQVDATTIEVDRRFDFGTSTCTLIEITSDTGHVGIGEIPDIEDPESAPSTTEIESELEDFLKGRDPRRLRRLTDEMYDGVDFGEFSFHSFQQLALGAVDTAVHDLLGRYYEMPVAQLLGGFSQDVPVQWVVFTRGAEDELEELRDEVQTKVDEGFSAFKLKVGELDPEVDLARIEAVRDIAGDEALVMLDAQGVWTLEEAIDNIQLFESAGIDAVETPVGHPDAGVDAPGYYYDVPLLPEELATVRERTNTPIAEHVLDPSFGLELVNADAVDIFTVEVCSGGIARASRVLDIAAAGDVDARLGSTVELGPGTAAAMALATADTTITYPCDLVGPALYLDNVLEDPITYEDGTLYASDRPGYGVDLSASVMDR